MNANDFTFGVEIETTAGPTAFAHGLSVGSYCTGNQVPYLPTGWNAKYDGSIKTQDARQGCEIGSPVLRGADGIRQVIEVCRALEAHGHKVNASCGVHVHVGWYVNEPAFGAAALSRLICLVAANEDALYESTGSKNRKYGVPGEQNWCQSIRRYGNAKQAHEATKGRTTAGHYQSERYHVLNLTNLATGRMPTVEFRVFSGSIDPVKIITWIRICVGLVELATKTTKAGRFAPKGKEKPMARLLRNLGWQSKSRPHCKATTGIELGAIKCDISVDDGCREMNRLAKKYNAETHPRENSPHATY